MLSTKRWDNARKESIDCPFWNHPDWMTLLKKMTQNFQEKGSICSTEGLKLFLKKLV